MYSKDDSGDKPKIKLPSVEVAGGELKPAKLPLGAYGLRYTRKFAAGGATGVAPTLSMMPSDGRMVPAVAGKGGGGLTGIRDAATGLIGTAEGVSKMSQSLVGGPSNTARAGQPPPGAMFKKGGKVSSASKRADGCAIRGKTRGKIV